MLIGMRMMSAGAGCAVTATGAAVIADIWHTKEKGHAMSTYYVGVLLGPSVGPLIGGSLTQRWGWRSTQWLQMAYGALMFLMTSLALPDTLLHAAASREVTTGASPLPQRQPQPLPKFLALASKRTCSAMLRPFHIVYFLGNPAIVLTVYLAGTTFLTVCALQISFQQSFAGAPYNFDSLKVGLAFLPFALGLLIGDLAGGKWSDHVMYDAAAVSNRYDDYGVIVLAPEDRVKWNAWVAVLLFPPGLIWYGWSIRYGTFCVVPVSWTLGYTTCKIPVNNDAFSRCCQKYLWALV